MDTPNNGLEVFDPLAEMNFEGDEDYYVEYIPPIQKPEEPAEPIEKPIDPAPVRIARTIKGMPGERNLLLHVIDFCREERTSQEVIDEIVAFRKDRVSMYTPETVCSLLERAGALEMIVDEEAADEEAEAIEEAAAVEEADYEPEFDGVFNEDEFLSMEEPPSFSYLATEDGLAAVAEDNPAARFEKILGENIIYAPLFRRVLEACRGEGLVKKSIDPLIDQDPLVQKPRRFSGYFIDKLEDAQAIAFEGRRWVTTAIGEAMMAEGGILAIQDTDDAAEDNA